MDCDRLLQQRRLHAHERGPDRRRQRGGQVTLPDGLDLLRAGRQRVSVTGNSFGLPLSKRGLEENVGRLGLFTTGRGGGAAGRHLAFFCRRFKRGQLEDIRGDWAVWGFELGEKRHAGMSSWYCSVRGAPRLWRQHVFILDPLVLLGGLQGSRRPGSSRHIIVERPLQVCRRKTRTGGQTSRLTLTCTLAYQRSHI